jgi:hypothetical protein
MKNITLMQTHRSVERAIFELSYDNEDGKTVSKELEFFGNSIPSMWTGGMSIIDALNEMASTNFFVEELEEKVAGYKTPLEMLPYIHLENQTISPPQVILDPNYHNGDDITTLGPRISSLRNLLYSRNKVLADYVVVSPEQYRALIRQAGQIMVPCKGKPYDAIFGDQMLVYINKDGNALDPIIVGSHHCYDSEHTESLQFTNDSYIYLKGKR